jgi:hypothetical protein
VAGRLKRGPYTWVAEARMRLLETKKASDWRLLGARFYKNYYSRWLDICQGLFWVYL